MLQLADAHSIQLQPLPDSLYNLECSLQIAKRQGVVNPENTFFSVKRFVGRKMGEIQSEAKQVPYNVSQLRQWPVLI